MILRAKMDSAKRDSASGLGGSPNLRRETGGCASTIEGSHSTASPGKCSGISHLMDQSVVVKRELRVDLCSNSHLWP